MHLLVLGTTTSRFLGSLNGLLVGCSLTTSLESAHETCGSLEWALELTSSWLAEDVDLNQVALECALQRDQGLDDERVGVLHVQVHEGHHSYTHQLRLEKSSELCKIIGVNGGGDELWLFGVAHWGRLDVLEGGQVYDEYQQHAPSSHWAVPRLTLLLVNLRLDVEVDTDDDQVRDDVHSSDAVEDEWVFEVDSLGYLHHHKDYAQVCAAGSNVSQPGARRTRGAAEVAGIRKYSHLRTDSHLDGW
jgi:hypothetical protein